MGAVEGPDRLVREVADEAHRLGYNAIPVRADGSKQPTAKWKEWQTRSIDDDEHDVRP